jgi:hypothetical protein
MFRPAQSIVEHLLTARELLHRPEPLKLRHPRAAPGAAHRLTG